MSTKMEEEIKRLTAKRKTALVLELIQGKTTVAEASRSFDIAPWAAAGFKDTLLRWSMKQEIANGNEKAIQSRVQG